MATDYLGPVWGPPAFTVGKTVIANIFLGGSMAMDPCDFLVVHPTEDNAGRWSKLKLSPMLKGTPALRGLFPEKSRDGSNSVLLKEHRDGLGAILISGANSPSSLSQVTMRREVQDDLSKWEMNAAGDPESQADSRSRAHEFAKILKASTPLVLPGCRITKSFEAGSQEFPYVPCPHCNEMQVLEWENMHAALYPAKPEEAHFTCIACGCSIEEHHRRQMLDRLEFRAHSPAAKREHRSFWIWSAYSYLQSFERIAREWLRAKGDPEAEKTFLNDTAGQAYKAASEAPPWEKLRDRAAQSEYPRGTIPAGGRYLVQLASGGVNGAGLPTPDATGTSNLAVTGGKVALVDTATALSCGTSPGSCSAVSTVEDLIGYGGAADYEGSGAAPAPSATTALARAGNGCTDTDNNATTERRQPKRCARRSRDPACRGDRL